MFEKIKEYLFIIIVWIIALASLMFLMIYLLDKIQVAKAYSIIFNSIFNN